MQPPAAKERRLLVIGDSISAGFGVLCNSSDGTFTPATESAYHAYPGIAARALDADLQDIAYSGKGAIIDQFCFGKCRVFPLIHC